MHSFSLMSFLPLKKSKMPVHSVHRHRQDPDKMVDITPQYYLRMPTEMRHVRVRLCSECVAKLI